jgi:hypothetical protein
MDDFHTLQERVSMVRIDYHQLLTDRDYLLRVGEMYHEAMRGISWRWTDSLRIWRALKDS